MVTLKNTRNRRQSFELPHQYICTADECFCTKVDLQSRTHDPQTGEIGTRSEETKVPRAVHIAARGVTEALPDAVLDVPAVADAIKRGVLTSD